MMNNKKKAVFNWSGGKDSALALYKVLSENEYEVVSLLTTINEETLSSSIHSIPLAIIEAQADSVGIPIYPIMLPKEMKGYEEEMKKAVHYFKKQGVHHFIFGDIFLHEVKAYREKQLRPYGIEVIEPLWHKTSQQIIEDFLASGIGAKIIVTQADKLNKTYIGRELDRDFIKTLPKDVDFCGENGEYHTLAYKGPLFRKEIKFSLEKPFTLSYDIRLDDGSIKTFQYWQAKIIAG